MHPRTTGLLLVATLALGGFIYLNEIRGAGAGSEVPEQGQRLFGEALEAEDIAWIALRTRDGIDVRLERTADAWQLVEPRPHRADAEVERLAELLATIESEAVIEHPQPLAEYGLDEGSARVVSFGTGEGSHGLWLGNETPVAFDGNTYARVDGSDVVHTVFSFRARAFEPPLFELRDKQILELDASDVREVEVRWPDGGVVVERVDMGDGEALAEPAWRLTEPVAARADAEVVYELLANLADLQAVGLVDAPHETIRRLLDAPDFEVTLRNGEPGSEPMLAVRIGRPNAEKQRPVHTAGAELFQIPADRIDAFPRDTISYRHRQLARFESTDAEELEFFFPVAGGDPLVVTSERNARGWSASPEDFEPGKLSRIVSELSQLRAHAVLSEDAGEAELTGFGLSPPKAILSVFGAAPPGAEKALPKLAEVHFGRASNDGVIARAAGDPTVYRLAPESAEHLPVSLRAFRERFRAKNRR